MSIIRQKIASLAEGRSRYTDTPASLKALCFSHLVVIGKTTNPALRASAKISALSSIMAEQPNSTASFVFPCGPFLSEHVHRPRMLSVRPASPNWPHISSVRSSRFCLVTKLTMQTSHPALQSASRAAFHIARMKVSLLSWTVKGLGFRV